MKQLPMAMALIMGGLAALPIRAGEPGDMVGKSEPARPPVAPADWGRIRLVSQALSSEEGTRKLYKDCPALAEAFPIVSNFMDMAGKWRPRISALPVRWEDAQNTDLAIMHKDDGSVVYYLTYHHAKPANAITILKAVWRDDFLVNLGFMKGFANIPFGSTSQQNTEAPLRYQPYTPRARHN